MAVLAFQKPEKVIMLENDGKFGRFEFRPLEPGYGTTIGNALRRILTDSLEGYAITTIKVDGAENELASLNGVEENMTDIILNLKQVRVRKGDPKNETEIEEATVNVSGQETVSAGDLAKALNIFEVVNPNFVICHLNEGAKFNMTFKISKGRGYVRANESTETLPAGTLAIDAIFTPIVNAKYTVDNFRVAQKTDYEKLLFEITTDGTILPKDALKDAARILIQHFMLFSDEQITLEDNDHSSAEEFDADAQKMRQLLKTKLSEMDLSVRALNCLKAAEVDTLGQLVKFNRNDLLRFRNFGRRSLEELDTLLSDRGLQFGMDVSKYKLDKD